MSAQTPYPVLVAPILVQEEIKKSRFITYLAHTPGRDAAEAFVREIKQKHADARHNCWAFVAGRPEDGTQYGFSDDGEPSGTAGKPILNVLLGSGLGEITAVVTRYSGGIKLGTGGLVRAYGGGVQQALQEARLEQKAELVPASVSCGYSQHALLENLLSGYPVTIKDVDYADAVTMMVEVDVRFVRELAAEITDKTHGQVVLTLPES